MSGKPDVTALHSGGRILAVDDQPENLMLLEDVLEDEGFEVRLAADGEEALREVDREAPDCIVLDIMMPRLDGFAVCRRLKGRRDTHFIPIVMLTALTEVKDKVRAYELGADDFLNKPVDVTELVARVRSLVRIKRLRDELDTSETIIVSMVQALESKDPRAAGHSHRVTVNAVRLARKHGLSPEQVELVAKGSILHDIGKIGLPDELLLGATNLSPEQVGDYRSHPGLGEQILSPFLSFSAVRGLVRHHHERIDGSGFPDGLQGDEVGLEVEIVALANAWDALTVAPGDSGPAAEELRAAARRGEFHADLVDDLLALHDMEAALGEESPPWQDLLPLPTTARFGKILVANASPSGRAMLQQVLAEQGHEVVLAESGDAVLDSVREAKPDLLLLDAHLPGRDGFDVCSTVKSRPETEFLPVILLTAHNERGSRLRGSEAGADDFLSLPVKHLELVARVKSLLRLRRYFNDLEEHQSVILSLASALEAKDPYTRGHSERVGVLAARLAVALGLPDEACQHLRRAGQLHDIGKIGMPQRLLNKRGPLSDDEFATVKRHPKIGERICRSLRTMKAALPLIRHHHERLDGSGYPEGLEGDSLPLGARILGLADAFDALTSARSYRKNFSTGDAIELLTRETEAGRWDPEVFAALAAMVRS